MLKSVSWSLSDHAVRHVKSVEADQFRVERIRRCVGSWAWWGFSSAGNYYEQSAQVGANHLGLIACDLAKSDRRAAKDEGECFFRIRKSIAVLSESTIES
jgi:hypothetical protein